MWVKFKKTYSGHLGFFEGGIKKDLPESIVNQLPKKFYEETCPPWEEQKDPEAIFQSKVANAVQAAKSVRFHADEAKVKAFEAIASVEETIKKIKSKPKKKRFKESLIDIQSLLEEGTRTDFELIILFADLGIAVASAGLKALDAADAEIQAGELTVKAAKKKAAAEAKAVAEAEAAAEAKAAETVAAEAAAAEAAAAEAKAAEAKAAEAEQEPKKEHVFYSEDMTDTTAKCRNCGAEVPIASVGTGTLGACPGESEDADQKDQVKKADDPQGDNPESEG